MELHTVSVVFCAFSAPFYAFSVSFYAFSTHFCSVSQCCFAPFPPRFHSIFYTVFSASLSALLRLFCTIFAVSPNSFCDFSVLLSPPLKSSSKQGFTPSFSSKFWRHWLVTLTSHGTQTIKNPPICKKPQLFTCKRNRIKKKKYIKPQIFQRDLLKLHQHLQFAERGGKWIKMGLNIAGFATSGDEAGANLKLKSHQNATRFKTDQPSPKNR